MINIKYKENCMGCSACVNICPSKCISMLPDNEGFCYPKVELQKCIKCNQCEKVCPILNEIQCNNFFDNTTAYAAINREESIRLKSASGGVFSLLAEKIIDDFGGTVFGAAFDDEYDVFHIGVNDKETLQSLYSSKYVQSNINDCYRNVKKMLDEGNTVLFSGTPCQIGGLRLFLQNKDYDKLYTVDFICHGVPSPDVWRNYLSCIKKKYGKISNVSFRSKKKGWKNSGFCVFCDDINKSVYEKKMKNKYLRGFLKNLYLRPSCHNCKFKQPVHAADLTLADLWGARYISPKLYDDKGCSLVIINSDKGKRIFDCIKDGAVYEHVKFADAMFHNTAILKSATAHCNRKEFFDRYKQEDICKLIDELCPYNFRTRVKENFVRIWRYIVRSTNRSCK